MLKFLHFTSSIIQILAFTVLYYIFLNYYSYRTGVEYSLFVKSGFKLYRDDQGVKLINNFIYLKVPNIIADNLFDGYFALGYVHSEDRLWQMYFSKQVALGQVSQVKQ